MSTPFRQSTELSSSQQEQELDIWRNLKSRCLGILCRVPVLQLAFDPLLSHLPTQRSPSLLLQVIRQSPLEGKKPASMSVIQLWECRAISVKSIFKENYSGCHWGHLGVCVLCSNCFISSEKKFTCYHDFAADSGFVERIHLITEWGGVLTAHTPAAFRTALSYLPCLLQAPGWDQVINPTGGSWGHCILVHVV